MVEDSLKYTGLALDKITATVKRIDFIKIISITPERVHIMLGSDECKISPLGKVTWSASKDFEEI